MKKLYILLFTLLITGTTFSQVFITELAEPNNNANARYIELYNAGATPVDLSTWRIDKYTNASATVSQTLALAGTIAAGGFYIIATGPEDTEVFTVFGVTPDQWDTASNNVAGSNGDDNLELYDGANALIDQFGVPGEDGTGTCHEFENGRVERKASLTAGNPTWDEAEWNVWADSTVSGCTSHVGTAQDAPAAFDPGFWIGTATGPTISLGGAVSGLDYFEGFGPSSEGSFSVDGLNLTEGILVTAPTNFEITLTSGGTFTTTVTVTQSSGTASDVVYVRLISGLTPNTYTDNASASSAGATGQSVSLSGIVTAADPQITVTAFLDPLNYSAGSGPSAEDSFTVEGLFLTSDIVVTSPSAAFELSLTSGGTFSSVVNVPFGSGTVMATDVFVRLASSLPEGPYSGNITVSSTGVTDELVAVTGNVFGPPTNNLVLTGAYDGPLTGGTPKGIELYVIGDIPDLSKFGVSSITNGGGSSAGNIEYTFPADAVSAGTYIWLATESPQFTAFFGFAPTYTNGAVGINGDDAIELYENGVIIDTFGTVDCDPNASGTTCPEWDHLDGWGYRLNNTGPDGGFVLANWYFSGANALDGETSNSTAATPFPASSYPNFLSVNKFDSNSFNVFPNPTNTGFVNISSINSEVINAKVFDILGKEVLNGKVKNNQLNVSNLNAGMYILKLSQNNATVTKKLIIQ